MNATTHRALQAHAERLFATYVAAQDRAKETLSVKDGVAAGKAWSRFIRLYEALPRTADDADASDGPSASAAAALCFSIEHLGVARDALLVGDRATGLDELRRCVSDLAALLEALPEYQRAGEFA